MLGLTLPASASTTAVPAREDGLYLTRELVAHYTWYSTSPTSSDAGQAARQADDGRLELDERVLQHFKRGRGTKSRLCAAKIDAFGVDDLLTAWRCRVPDRRAQSVPAITRRSRAIRARRSSLASR
jgi:hypothetical protein